MKWLYLLVDLFTVLIPLLFSFHPKIKFYKHWKAFFTANMLVAVVFLVWDGLFTHLNVWNFNDRYVSGFYFVNLPVEEFLFFICIPYACVFTYHCLDKFYKLDWKPKTESLFCILLSSILLVTGLVFLDRLYTSATFISTAIICLLFKFGFKISWWGKSITVYALLLIPFFIVNGILTGTGLEEPVVLYNNRENLGIRLLTIPFEDVFYGYEMILLNLFFYHLFKYKSTVVKGKSSAYNTGRVQVDTPTKPETVTTWER